MTERKAEVRGVVLGYDVEGDGPLVVHAHGLTSSRANERADGLFDLDPVIAAGFRLLRYDARGHGTSTGSTDPDDYHWDALADDLLALLDLVAPDGPVAAIGCSMGTGTLLHAASKAPDRFSALVLTAPPTAWQTRAAQAGTYRTMADAVESGDQQRLEALFADAVQPAIFADRPPIAPDITPVLFATVLRGAAGTDLPSPEALAAITQPTLLLPWDTDPGHPVSTAEVLAGAISGATLRVAHTVAEIAGFGGQAASFLRGVGRTGEVGPDAIGPGAIGPRS